MYLIIDPSQNQSFYDWLARLQEAVGQDSAAWSPGSNSRKIDPVSVPDALWALVTGLANPA